MNFTFLYALIFVVIPLAGYFLFAFVVIFHIRKYGMDKLFNKKAILVFCFGLITVSIMIVQKFSAVDWNKVSVARFIENADINFFYGNYDR